MKRIYAAFVAIVFLVGARIDAFAAPKILRVSDQKQVALSQCLEDLDRSDVIFMGDTHDDRQLHDDQLEMIRGLYGKHPKLAIALEMFTIEGQQDLDSWVKGGMGEEAFQKIYAKNWSYPWPLYRELFLFARDNHIPMIALNVPKPIISKVVRQGHQALNEEDKKALPPKVSWELNPAQAEYLKRIRTQLFGNRQTPFPATHFAEAQALRNDTMAWNIYKYASRTADAKVVVIAGTWHAIRNGSPESLRLYGIAKSKIVLPDLVEFSGQLPTPEEADYLILK